MIARAAAPTPVRELRDVRRARRVHRVGEAREARWPLPGDTARARPARVGEVGCTAPPAGPMTSPAPPTALAWKYATSRSVTRPSSAMPSLCGVLAMRFLSVSPLIDKGENSVGNMAPPCGSPKRVHLQECGASTVRSTRLARARQVQRVRSPRLRLRLTQREYASRAARGRRLASAPLSSRQRCP